MTNAEKMAKQCPYDTLVELNKNMAHLRKFYKKYCIVDVLEGKLIMCKADSCEECIRLWRLEEVKP